MSDYRHTERLAREFGEYATKRRSMLTWPDITEQDQGGTAIVNAQGSDNNEPEEFDATVCYPVGYIARPDRDANVTGCMGLIGGSGDHPVILNTIDWLRRDAVGALGLELGERLLYSAKVAVKLCADALVEIRSWAGVAAALPTMGDFDRLNQRIDALESAYNAHVHLGVTPGTLTSGIPQAPSTTSASFVGTSVFRAE